MASRHEIVQIDFQASAGRANAAIKSIQAEAERASQQVKELRQQLKTAPKDMPLEEYKKLEERFAAASKRAKEWEKANRDLSKGVTTLDEAIKMFNQGKGTIEGVSEAFASAAKNAARLQQKRSLAGTKDWKEMDALIHALDQIIVKSQIDINGLVGTVKKGGAASKAVLEQAKRDLEALRNTEIQGSKEWKEYNAQIQIVGKSLSEMRKQEISQSASILGKKNLNQFSETEIRSAINSAKELLATYKTGNAEAQELSNQIVRAEEHLKAHGVEAARQAAKETAAIKTQEEAEKQLQVTMNKRLQSLKSLSADALAETRKYWEAQRNGAEQGSAAFNKAEAALKKITNQERTRKVAGLDQILGDPGKFGIDQVRAAVQEMEKLRGSVREGSNVWLHYNKMVEQGKAYLEQLSQSQAAQRINQQMQNLNTLSTSGLAEVRKYWETMVSGAARGSAELATYESKLKEVAAEEKRRTQSSNSELAAKLYLPNSMFQLYSESEIKASINATRELMSTIQMGKSEYKQYAENIVRAEEYLKQYGVEAERARQKQAALNTQMRDRMGSITTLSDSALQETKRYWEDLARTQGLAEKNLSSYRTMLEKVVAEERRRKEVAAEKVIGNMSNYSDNEIRQAIQSFEMLRDAQKHGNVEWEYYNKRVQEGKRYLEEWARVDSVIKMEEQMQNLTRLSDTALQETKKFWETMVAGADKGSSELREYEAHLQRVTQEEKERKQLSNEQSAQKIMGRYSLSFMSESEIRQSIEAAKKLQQTVNTGERAYREYGNAIAFAEEHLKKFGLEAQRAAREQELMKNQLYNQGSTMSDSALKAQAAYWQRLIDDPKTAAASLQEYKSNLEEVQRLQSAKITTKGADALNRFRRDPDYAKTASAEELKQSADALKRYRDSLPQQANADLIKEIDGYLAKLGTTASNSAKQAMTLKEALNIGKQAQLAGANNVKFTGTIDELKRAKKALEEMQQSVVKGGYAWRRMQESIDSINLELRRTGFISKEVDAILSQPKGRSFNELKLAVEQGRAALQNMRRTTADEQKAFDELAKKVKEADIQMKQLGNSSRGTATAFSKAWSRLKTYIGLYVGAAVAMQKIVSTFGEISALSDKLGEVRKTTGLSADEVGHLSDNLKKLDTRTSLNGLLELSVAAGQLGLKSTEDIEGFTEAANKLMVALPEMGKEGATQMLKVALATGEIDKINKQMMAGEIHGSSAVAVAMEKVGSTIDRLRASSASTAPAITDFVQRVGAVGAQSGISIDQVAALGSTVDALGMRVEMSATALSRMLPAIRNNAFDISRILGVTPESIRNLYDAGRGMEVVLMILQHIKDANMSADSIETMLGKGGMSEIMKELNQQGARAGIVFGGLSQNVDELRRQLVIANEAYAQNIAIQNEYDKMNETTAAKWERLKNQLSEMFVSDSAQRFLGGFVDLLRGIVDFISGNVTPALQALRTVVFTVIAAWATFKIGLGEAMFIGTVKGLKSLWDTMHYGLLVIKDEIVLRYRLVTAKNAEAAATIRATLAQKGLNSAMRANIIMAVVAAIGYLIWKIAEWADANKEAGREAARFNAQLRQQQDEVKKLTNDIGAARVKIENAESAVKKARAEVDAAKNALEAARRANENTTEAVRRLTKAESELLSKEEQKKNAMAEHKRLIESFNNQYSKYIGFMLSEVSSNLQLARARDLVNAKLRETLILKRKEAALTRIENTYGKDRDERYADLYTLVHNRVGDPTKAARILDDLTKAAYSGKGKSGAAIKKILQDNDLYVGMMWQAATDYAQGVEKIQFESSNVERQSAIEGGIARGGSQRELIRNVNAGFGRFNSVSKRYKNAKGEDRARLAAELLQLQDTQYDIKNTAPGYYDMNNPKEAAKYRRDFAQLNAWSGGYNRRTLIKEAGKYYTPRKTMEINPEGVSASAGGFSTGSNMTVPTNTGSSSWGETPEAASTDYSSWDVDELVARRKQMDKFKNVLKDGIDVRAVLAEDSALMRAIDKGEVDADNWHSVLNWYDKERKKIQEELRVERRSTNEGHWRDEHVRTKKGHKTVRKNIFYESDYALAELDRYYSRRKEALEKASIEENMSEELFNRRAEQLEQEHLERRAKLRGTFTKRISSQESAAFKEWWKKLEAQFELDNVNWNTIATEWAKATNAHIGRNNLNMQKDLTKMQEMIVKHMNQIAKIIAKERPYDTITDNLRKNLTEMDILFVDMEKNGTANDVGKLVDAQYKRMSVLMELAEKAYSLTNEDLLNEMRVLEYTGDWAVALEEDDTLVNALMAQLRKTYDEIQSAIQKESSLIKKQLEIIWNDAVPQLGGQSRKGMFESVLSRLGLEEDRLKSANSLIGAGPASEGVADKLAIKRMQLQLTMQEHYYNLMRAKGLQRIEVLNNERDAEKEKAKLLKEQAATLREQGKEEEALSKERQAQLATQKSLQAGFDAEHAATALNLALKEETKKTEEQRVEISKRLEESQQRLHAQLKEWNTLLVSSVQGIFEASHAGDAEYYNERAKMNLTGKGGPGAGTYIVIDNEGTSDATAHYEYLDEREALERQREIQRENALADAWKKVMDDINMKMSDLITDQLNKFLQNAVMERNNQELDRNTAALEKLNATAQRIIENSGDAMANAQGVKRTSRASVQFDSYTGEMLSDNGRTETYPGSTETEVPTDYVQSAADTGESMAYAAMKRARDSEGVTTTEELFEPAVVDPMEAAQAQMAADNAVTDNRVQNAGKEAKAAEAKDRKQKASAQSTYAAMAQAVNMYGIAYQTMSNENLDATQKFMMFALQAAGQTAIAMLTTNMLQTDAQSKIELPGILGKSASQLGPIAGPIAFAVMTAILGGLMAVATSKVTKAKGQIAQVTGASASAGRLATGMLTYGEGNVNEFTDPTSLTVGRSYNVDAADGRTYRAKYMGTNPRTHITTGPEFHLVGEAGREAIIDAKTTRRIQMDDSGIWQYIQTLYNGGRLSSVSRRRGRVPAYADGNLDEFAGYTDNMDYPVADMEQMRMSLDRNSSVQEALLERLSVPIEARFDVYGTGGLIDSYDKGKRELSRHGEKR